MNLETVEDYLEVLAGLQTNHKIEIDSSDCTIMYSIARQVFRGKAFTDRQLSVVCSKLEYYRNQFEKIGYTNLQSVINMQVTRKPLRSVDRSQWIKIVDEPKRVPTFTTSRMGKRPVDKELAKNSHVAIRFPFSKKIIQLVESLAHKYRKGYYHEKGSHVHYFKISENTVCDIVDNFKNKDYEIQQELLDYAQIVKDIQSNPQDYVPGVYDFKLKNTTKELDKKITEHLGELTDDNIHLYKDRSILYGLEYFDDIHTYVNKTSVLTQRIINRTSPSIFVSRKEWSIDALVSSIAELRRFPLLVILPESSPLDHLSQVHQSLIGFVGRDKISVLVRLENKTNKDFNDYIRDNKLNNPLAKNTEVVYISASKKFPKPLLQSDWKQESILFLESIRSPKIENNFYNDDLIVHFDDVESQMGSYVRHMSSIQKI